MTRFTSSLSYRIFGIALSTIAACQFATAQDDQAAATEPPPLELSEDQDSTLRDALEMLADDDFPEDSGSLGDTASKSIFEGRIANRGPGGFKLPPLRALTTSKESIGNGSIPDGFQGQETAAKMPLPESGQDRGLAMPVTFAPWAAPNTFSHPLYFEDRMLERHGHVRLGVFQPLASATRFVAQTAMLPYLSTIASPCKCEYSLGYYRAGDCVPALRQRPPYKRKAVAAQLTATAIGATILP